MHIGIHILRNYPYTCLNRDGSGEVKQVTFGGSRRTRISSQCKSYWIRKEVGDYIKDTSSYDSVRTKHVVGMLFDKLDFIADIDERQSWAELAVKALFDSEIKGKKKVEDEDVLTNYLVATSPVELDFIANLIKTDVDNNEIHKNPKAFSKFHKKALKDKSYITLDIALHGRMLASASHSMIRGAASRAHSISTHQITLEHDYFSAIDDYKQEHKIPGAGHVDSQSATSSCFYESSSINYKKLIENLGGNEELAKKLIVDYLRPLLLITPRAKSGSMNGNVLPSFVMITMTENITPMLSNAFVKAIYGNDIVEESVERLISFFEDEVIEGAGYDCNSFVWAEKRIKFDTKSIKRVDGIDGLQKALKESL